MIDTIVCFPEQDLDGGKNLYPNKVEHDPDGPNPQYERHKTDKDQRTDAPTGVQQQISTHKSKNRPACPDARDTRVRLDAEEFRSKSSDTHYISVPD